MCSTDVGRKNESTKPQIMCYQQSYVCCWILCFGNIPTRLQSIDFFSSYSCALVGLQAPFLFLLMHTWDAKTHVTSHKECCYNWNPSSSWSQRIKRKYPRRRCRLQDFKDSQVADGYMCHGLMLQYMFVAIQTLHRKEFQQKQLPCTHCTLKCSIMDEILHLWYYVVVYREHICSTQKKDCTYIWWMWISGVCLHTSVGFNANRILLTNYFKAYAHCY